MKARRITERVSLLGAVDWNRRIFDSLVPIPDGTTYNAYLVRGSEKTALIDTADVSKSHILMAQLAEVDRIDYVIANHAEPDHSGSLPQVLNRYPAARLLTTPKGKQFLCDLLGLPQDRIDTVEDGGTLSLGDRTLQFFHMPWVHWPETMVTYLPEERVLFSCDFFGSHYASNQAFAATDGRLYLAAKRYYAEIMMPFRTHIMRHLERLKSLAIEKIAPSHGPVYDDPSFILNAYGEWAGAEPKNFAAILSVSMHGRTRLMTEHLVAELTARNVGLREFDLTTPEVDEIAMALVDAATIVIATPTVLGGPHPNALYAAQLAGLLRPKAKFAAVIGSYSWGTKTPERIKEALGTLKVQLLEPVLVKGEAREEDLRKLENLAEQIAGLHREAGLTG